MIYAFGDIHGQRAMLQALLDALNALPIRDEDTLVFLGDYIDRGEDSRAVMEMLMDLRERHADTIFLRGNHEQLMLDALEGPPPEASPQPGFVLHSDQTLLWLQNGGMDTLLSYGVEDFSHWWEGIPDSHWEFIRATRMEYVTDRFHFVHAGLLPPGRKWEHARLGLDPRLWIREPFLSSRADFEGRIVVFGHTPQMSGEPLIKPNKICLDTAAVFGQALTAAALDPDPNRPAVAQLFQVRHDPAEG